MPDRELLELQEDIETLNAEWVERKRARASTARLARSPAAGWYAAVALLVLLLAGSPAPAQVFGPPAALNTNADDDSGHDQYPQVTTDGAGNWVAVWSSADSLDETIGTDADILVARSTDNGASWTEPAALNDNAATDSGQDAFPQVTTDRAGKWVAVWNSDDSLGATIGTDADILVARSTDNGASWTPPAALNSNAGGDSGDDVVPQVTTDGAGDWVAVWQSTDSLSGTINTDRDILVAWSEDNGANWTPPAALNSNAGGDTGEDYNPQVTTDDGDNWVAVWQSTDSLSGTIDTDRDILVALSTDDGASWTPPAALNTNAATDSGDDDNPQVTTDGAGNWVAVWRSTDSLGDTIGLDADILVALSTDDGGNWTAPVALNTNAGTDGGGDHYPQVTTDGAGTWGTWVAVWESTDSLGGTIGADRDILVARATHDGAVWTAPAALGTNAGSDSGHDQYPQVTTNGTRSWVVVWQSTDSLGDTIETDYDILVATGWGTSIPALVPPARALAAVLLMLAAGGWLGRRRHR